MLVDVAFVDATKQHSVEIPNILSFDLTNHVC